MATKAELEAKVAGLEKSLATAMDEIATLTEAQTSYVSRIDEQDREIAELQTRNEAAMATLGELTNEKTELHERLDALIIDYNDLVDRQDDEEKEPAAMVDCNCKLCNAAREHAPLINSGRMSVDELLGHGV